MNHKNYLVHVASSICKPNILFQRPTMQTVYCVWLRNQFNLPIRVVIWLLKSAFKWIVILIIRVAIRNNVHLFMSFLILFACNFSWSIESLHYKLHKLTRNDPRLLSNYSNQNNLHILLCICCLTKNKKYKAPIFDE